MHVVGRGRPAARSVVEHRHCGVGGEDAVYLAVVAAYVLRLVTLLWYGEVYRQYGERIDKNPEIVVHRLCELLLRHVLPAEEALPSGYRLLGDVGSCRHDARRIVLHHYGVVSARQLPCPHLLQSVIARSGVVPLLKLAVEESHERVVRGYVGASLSEQFPCRNLHRAQSVLVEVVGVEPLYAQRGVAVASPAAAEIQFVIYAPYPVLAAEDESHGIVLAVACVGECGLAHQRSEERPRRTQSVYAQGVVRTVCVGPFLMVNYSRRQCVEVKVAHAVAAYYHRRFLRVEGVYYALQRVR